MSNTQTITGGGCIHGFFTEENKKLLQNKITLRISQFYTQKTVIVPIDNIYGTMIHFHESTSMHLHKRGGGLDMLNNIVIEDFVQEFKNHLRKNTTSNYYLDNEYTHIKNSHEKSFTSYRLNDRARKVQFQTTF